MPQPKWYHKSLSELCMDSIVDNMEKWTAIRSSVHVSSLFSLLRKYEIVGYCYYCYFIMLFGLHTAYHCLEYMTKNWWFTEDMFDLLLNPHTKVLNLSRSPCLSPDYLRTGCHAKENLRICGLASIRCSVIINSAIL
jgi:hypothetical protein